MKLTVNVSPTQLLEASFRDEVLAILGSHALDPSDVVLEITESAMVRQEGLALAHLRDLQARGCQVAIDDFGAGFSNLGQLLATPLDLVKVDRALLIMLSEMRTKLGGAPDQPCAIMTAIVEIGGAVSAPIVAEGVETIEQWESLRRSGVQLLQGYFFSRPVDAPSVPELLAAGLDVGARPDSAFVV